MKFITDLHLHSRYSRATSKDLTIENLEKWARVKGINILGTGDFQHPEHRKEIDKELIEDDNGILRTKSGFCFIWQTEISLIYTQNNKGRAVHVVVLAPNKNVADKITSYLLSKGRIDYDGRPIFGIPADQFVKDLKLIDDKIEIIPAHCMTPYFGLFGSKKGFDSLKECFQDQRDKIYAVESGLSADPSMLWRMDEKINIVSFSDSHCVHPDTMITLKDGFVLPISEIENENYVSCMDIKEKLYRQEAKIQYSRIKAPEEIINIIFSGGEIKISNQHRFYVFRGGTILEKYAYELKKGDLLFRLAKIPHCNKGSITFKKNNINYYICKNGLKFIQQRREQINLTQKDVAKRLGVYSNHYWKIENGYIKISEKNLIDISGLFNFNLSKFKKNFTKLSNPISYPNKTSIKMCELLGYFVGDGSYQTINHGRCLLLTDKNEDILKYYQKVVRDLFSCKTRMFKYSQQNSYGLIIPAHVAHFFELNFPDIILKSKIRRVPRFIYNLPLDEIAGFLRGYFDAEGSVGNHSVDACSANKLLIYQIDSLLKKFGIYSSLYLNQLEKIKKKYRHRITLYGENLRVFSDKINFNHKLKKLKLNKYTSGLLINRASKPKKIGNFVLSEIKSIKKIKSNTTFLYDLATSKYKNYIANQVVVHNSFWPWRLGREATIFDIPELTYDNIIRAIRTGEGLFGTIETPPEYGIYHFDGHKDCNFSCSSQETKKLNGICPICKRQLTIGVEYRIGELAKHEEGYKQSNAKIYYKLIPLHELIALNENTKLLASKKVWKVYNELIENFGTEFDILLNATEKQMQDKLVNSKLIKLILLNRQGKIKVKPGYDGVYGEPQLNLNLDQALISQF
jgi:PHP family Zn ribbon phosphoesterase/intein/homing endonuclease